MQTVRKQIQTKKILFQWKAEINSYIFSLKSDHQPNISEFLPKWITK